MGRKILFKHKRAVGDALMLTSGIRDFKLLFPDIQINVDSNFPDLWENNPYIDWSIQKGNTGVEYYEVGYPTIQTCNNGYIHFTHAFLLDMISQADAHESLGISVGEFVSSYCNGGDKELGESDSAKEPFITWRKKYKGFCKDAFRQWGDIHLTEQEQSYNMIKDVYGIDTYWVIAPGGKSDCTTKIWDWRRFQEVIDYYDGMIKFVTIGRSDHILDKLNNVIDLTDKTQRIRDLIPLVYHADGCVSGVSFLMHLAAAMPPKNRNSRKPCVAIYGGREPTSFTAYCNHQILHTNGALTCCDNGGCWQSRVVPIGKAVERNERLCYNTVLRDGRTIPLCMDMITSKDVIRAIERYYQGNIYKYSSMQKVKVSSYTTSMVEYKKQNSDREINILASLQSKGGGEQSACKIVELLRNAGWKVNFYPWDKVHDKYANIEKEQYSFKNGMLQNMITGIPLLFYANDQIWDFCDENKTKELVEKSSDIIIGINYANGSLPKCNWLAKSGKITGIIFQNEEKRNEFKRDSIGFDNVQLISLFGAINLNECLEVAQRRRNDGESLVVLKHGTPDYRKYTTKESVNNGDKIHIWQKHIIPELDTQFYQRLIKDIPDIRFEFMEAHPELVSTFQGDSHFVFHKFDSISVTEFLARGHIYLHKTSKMWRDQYPRSIAEALAAGLPILGEPRDGVKDRIVHGVTGFYCIDYDSFLYSLKLLKRKENFRFDMGTEAKKWAKVNLDPRKWVDVIDSLVNKKV